MLIKLVKLTIAIVTLTILISGCTDKKADLSEFVYVDETKKIVHLYNKDCIDSIPENNYLVFPLNAENNGDNLLYSFGKRQGYKYCSQCFLKK